MKRLKQIVCNETPLTLIKEKKQVEFGKEFEVSDERAEELLKVTYKGKPVVEVVPEKDTPKKTENKEGMK